MSRKSSCEEPCASTVIFSEQVLDQIAAALGLPAPVPPAINFIPTSVWQPLLIANNDDKRKQAAKKTQTPEVQTVVDKTTTEVKTEQEVEVKTEQPAEPSTTIDSNVAPVTTQRTRIRRPRKSAKKPAFTAGSGVSDPYLQFSMDVDGNPIVTYTGPVTATYIVTGQITLTVSIPTNDAAAPAPTTLYDEYNVYFADNATVAIVTHSYGGIFNPAGNNAEGSFNVTVPFNDTFQLNPNDSLTLVAEDDRGYIEVLTNPADDGDATQITFQRVSPLP